jgi:glucan 1,3-beta-glucosidase
MYKPVSLFTFVAAIIVAAWWKLGSPVPIPPSPLDPGEKLYCVSYAPFRGTQTPLDRTTQIDPRQIEDDLARLARFTDCIRIYSVNVGLERIPEIAQRHGLKVLLGLWVSSNAEDTQAELRTGIEIAKRFPDVVRAVIVGNEALLRGEVSPDMLRGYIESVKSHVPMPVTYADVWEFWMRYRELASAVDFVTIHILPYWEDEPVAAHAAADHVDSIRRHVATNFPGKEVMIGEMGWPSAGRMRHGALPSPADQARVMTDVLTRGKREHFRINVIEAFDQPWKRTLEGTVGGHWGLFDGADRAPKFVWGEALSNHPFWRWQAAGGVVLAGLVFAAAVCTRRAGKLSLVTWLAIALNASVAGILIGWTIGNVPLESLGAGGWLRSLSLAAIAILSPVVGAAGLAAGIGPPSFDAVLGRRADRVQGALALGLGVLLIALAVLAMEAALPLSFDPRYRDFPFAPLTAAALPFLLLPGGTGRRPLAETITAAVLLLCAIFIVWNETLANWQALWFTAAVVIVAVSLLRVRAAPG